MGATAKHGNIELRLKEALDILYCCLLLLCPIIALLRTTVDGAFFVINCVALWGPFLPPSFLNPCSCSPHVSSPFTFPFFIPRTSPPLFLPLLSSLRRPPSFLCVATVGPRVPCTTSRGGLPNTSPHLWVPLPRFAALKILKGQTGRTRK